MNRTSSRRAASTAAAVLGVAAVAAAVVKTASASPARPAAAPEPTVVPVHGASAGSSSRNAATARLQHDHRVIHAAQRFMARRAHARTVEADASHAATVSRPATVTRLGEQAARTTTR
ncbi:hypothetical protein LO771_17145 [Streptacidiphilus sp. ASG 303]|uniref:hypothetical protein n=1 Tax=Streptacidiphilus sp. ASG 303 TaxID=2896847 RepID=UPI001E53ED20|nr:hypothetical protein [Streptacidiphilus sp. ASG 303]MCD0484071.1 hypothetical protein [Streptacidiphilus sp. ASG 303]